MALALCDLAVSPTQGFQPKRALLVVALTIITAATSYHLIEMPIRQGIISRVLTNRRVYTSAATLMILTAFFASFLGGTPVSAATMRLLPGSTELQDDIVMVVGDSVPKRLIPEITGIGRKHGYQLLDVARGICSPMSIYISTSAGGSDDQDYCSDIKDVQEEALNFYRPGVVLWWSRQEIINRYDDGRLLDPSMPEFWAAQQRDLDTAVARLTKDGAKLVFVKTERSGLGMLDRPEEELASPVIKSLIYDDASRIRFNQMLQDIADKNPNVYTIDGDSLFCSPAPGPGPGELCDDSVGDSGYIRYDGTHVQLDKFAEQIGEELLRRLDAVLKQ